MINAYKNFFKGYAEFTGRSTRPDYWWVWLGNFILSIPFWVIYIYTVYLSAVMDSVSDSASEAAFMIFGLVAIIYVVFYLAILVPTIALTVRRLRDAGFHWAFIFLRFAPMVGGIALLVLLAMPTKETEVVNYSEPQAVKNEEATEDTPFEESDKN
jgi:membrane protein